MSTQLDSDARRDSVSTYIGAIALFVNQVLTVIVLFAPVADSVKQAAILGLQTGGNIGAGLVANSTRVTGKRGRDASSLIDDPADPYAV